MNVRTLIAFSLFSSTVGAVTPGLQPEAVVQQYCDATRGQEQLMQGSSMSVEIAASLPKLKKQGKLHALRRVSALGRITYEILGFEGDGTVKKQIINRYLSAEAEAQEEPTLSVAITPENYKFKHKRQDQLEGRDTYLFEVSPKHKRQGLFQGQLWIDCRHFPARAGIRLPGEDPFDLAEKGRFHPQVSRFAMASPCRGRNKAWSIRAWAWARRR